MSSSGGGEVTRVSIPGNAKKTIQDIREITGKQHSDEEIYAVLRECSMDPNETAQKLLYLDTFHEVKRKRDRRKETAVPQGRGARNGRGNYSSNYSSSDAGGGRFASAYRESGVNHVTDRGSMPPQVSHKSKTNATSQVTKSPTVAPNGLPNGSHKHGLSPQSSVDLATFENYVGKSNTSSAIVASAEYPTSIPTHVMVQEKSTSGPNQPSHLVTPISASGVCSSTSDPVLAPSISPRAGFVVKIKQEVSLQQESVEPNCIQGNKVASPDIALAENKKETPNISDSMQGKKAPVTSSPAEQKQLSEPLESSVLQVMSSELVAPTTEANPAVPKSNDRDGQIVTFPLHFQISEALKNGLTFGSFDASFGLGIKLGSGNSGDSSIPVASSQGIDDMIEGTSPSKQLEIMNGDTPDEPESPPATQKILERDLNMPPAGDLKADQPNKEMQLQAECNQSLGGVQNAPTYNFGFIPPLSTSHLVPFDGTEAQQHDVLRPSNLDTASSPAPSSTPTPPIQSTVAATPQAVPLFRQPYPPSYFPYAHYLHPFFLPPMQQFLSPNGLPQQASAGNMYLPPNVGHGVKYPLPQFKTGANAGNQAQITIPSGYGSFGSTPVGFSPIPTVTSASSASTEDLATSQFKENHIYTTGPLSEGSALWMAPPGQDISNLQVNSLYNFPLHGQHVAFSPAQPGHSTFTGLYQQPQNMGAPQNVNPLLQQTQTLSAVVEAVGPPNGAYQQPQLAQMNWSANY